MVWDWYWPRARPYLRNDKISSKTLMKLANVRRISVEKGASDPQPIEFPELNGDPT
jgi:hypothetical protein